VPDNPLDLWQVLVPLHQSLLVRLLVLLPRQRHPQLLGSFRLPHAHVHVVRPREDVGAVPRELHREDALHAFGVVDVAAVAAGVGEDAHAAVVAAGDELAAGGGVIDVDDGGDKVLWG
jgi:hypothetical protein